LTAIDPKAALDVAAHNPFDLERASHLEEVIPWSGWLLK